jgi:hypothetical protein
VKEHILVAELDAEPEVLTDGTLIVPYSGFAGEGDLPEEGDVVVLSWPEGMVRGVAVEARLLVRPEITARRAASSDSEST